MTPDELNCRLSDQIGLVMSNYFPEAKKTGGTYKMGDLNGNGGASTSIFRGSGGVYLAKDHETDESINILGLLHRILGKSWSDTIAEAKKICGVEEVREVRSVNGSVRKPVMRSSANIRDGLEGTETFRYLSRVRGLLRQTLLLYNVRNHHRQSRINRDFWLVEFIDTEGDCVMFKSTGVRRDARGRKDIWSSSPAHATLWGWWLVSKNTRRIMICEGEIDAMSAHQMGAGMPCLSLPSGASNLSWIDNDYERLEEFEEIYLLLDNDKPGQEAAQKIAKRLGLLRCRLVKLPKECKDVNDYLLLAGRGGDDFPDAVKSAEYHKPAQLIAVTEMADEIEEEILRFEEEQKGNTFMWPDIKFRFRPGELSLVAGYPSHGKSQWVYQVILHEMLYNSRRTCMASFEIPRQKMLFNLLWMQNGVSPKLDTWRGSAKVFSDLLWYIKADEGKEMTWDILSGIFLYCIRRYGHNLFVIDALTHLVAKDDWSGQEAVAKAAHKFCVDNDVSILLICHCDAKKRSSGKIPELEDVLGGQGIGAAADNACILWRNQVKEKKVAEGDISKKVEAAPDAKLYIAKQRATGILVYEDLWFDPSTRIFSIESQVKKASIPEEQYWDNW